MDSRLKTLTRKRDRAGDRGLVDEVFDNCQVATLATVVDDEPWTIPILAIRDRDRLLLHGSTGAGALVHVAAGAKVAISAFLLDGLVVAERAVDHSANYRSAVVRGTCRRVGGSDAAAVLDLFTDALLPGRSVECPPHSGKELAQTQVLELLIGEDNWVAKERKGPPTPPDHGGWTGVVPIAQVYGRPIHTSPGPVPPSVAQVIGDRPHGAWQRGGC